MEKRAECIAFSNYKGGTGKTTSCLSIAGYLAKSNKKVLVVDFDPQANATSGLGIDAITLRHTMYDTVLYQCKGYEGVPITDIILDTGFENIHLAPSEFDLSVAELILQQMQNKVYILDHILEEIKELYDFILIDLPSSPGTLSLNGLCAADHLILSLDPCIYSIEALDNIKTTFRNIRSFAGHSINKVSAVLIRYKTPGIFRRKNPSRQYAQNGRTY